MPSTLMWCDPAVALVTYSVCRGDQSCGTRGLAAARLTGPRSMCPRTRVPAPSPTWNLSLSARPFQQCFDTPCSRLFSKNDSLPSLPLPSFPVCTVRLLQELSELTVLLFAPPGTSSRLTSCLVAGSPLGRGDRWSPRVRPGRSGAHSSMGPCWPLLASGHSLPWGLHGASPSWLSSNPSTCSLSVSMAVILLGASRGPPAPSLKDLSRPTCLMPPPTPARAGLPWCPY